MFDWLFGRSKELMAALEKKEQQLAECREVLREANALQEHEKDYFLKVTEDRARLAQGLARVATESRKGKDLSIASSEETEKLAIELSALFDEVKKSDSAAEKLLSAAESKETAALASTRQALDESRREAAALSKRLRDTETLLDGISDYFRKISVMALSAAIEGQKSGTDAKEFVSLAEGIRALSDEKVHIFEALREEILAGAKEADTLEKSLPAEIPRETPLPEDALHALRDADLQKRPFTFGRVQKDMEKLLENQNRVTDSEDTCLRELDQLGSGFLEEQKAAEEAEYFFRQVLGEKEA